MSSARAKIGPGGRLVIPAAQRRELGLEVGDQVVVRVVPQVSGAGGIAAVAGVQAVAPVVAGAAADRSNRSEDLSKQGVACCAQPLSFAV